MAGLTLMKGDGIHSCRARTGQDRRDHRGPPHENKVIVDCITSPRSTRTDPLHDDAHPRPDMADPVSNVADRVPQVRPTRFG